MKHGNGYFRIGKWYYLVILIFPALVLVYALAIRNASGPFWLGNNHDPDYAYLMNSLNISQGIKVFHAHHPGSTLQLLGCLLLYLINLVAGETELVNDVLTRPEFYLSSMHFILVVFLFITLAFVGALSLKWTGDIVGSILIQSGIFLSYTVRVFVFPRMMPELLLLILSVWMVVFIMYHKHLISVGSFKEPSWQYGIVSGLGIALKITFAPLIILPLFLIKSIKNHIIYIFTLFAVFFVVTANPFMNFKGFMEFLSGSLVARQGYNKPLIEGSTNLEAMWQGLNMLLDFSMQYEPTLLWIIFAFTVAAIIVCVACFFYKEPFPDSFDIRLWCGLLIVITSQFLLVANGPKSHYHYITPSLGLIGLFAFLSWYWPVTIMENFSILKNIYKVVYLLFMTLIIVPVLSKFPSEILSVRKNADNWLEVYRFKESNGLLTMPIIYYFRSSGVDYALDFGNSISGNSFSSKLVKIYPDSYMYNVWNNNIYSNFGTKTTTLDEIIKRSGSVLVQGAIMNYPIIPGLDPDSYPNKNSPNPKKKRNVLPVKTHQEFSSEVLFQGKNEWLVVVR